MMGNKCRAFHIELLAIPLDYYTQGDTILYSRMATLFGDEHQIKKFMEALKHDRDVVKFEQQGSTLVLTSKKPLTERIPSSLLGRNVFLTKPVFHDQEGYEYYEVGSTVKKHLMTFIQEVKTDVHDLEFFRIMKIEQVKCKDIYFPSFLPKLTDPQKRALNLAIIRGYYNYPRKVELKQLADETKCSLSTFREHLRRAEKKVMPDLLRTLIHETQPKPS